MEQFFKEILSGEADPLSTPIGSLIKTASEATLSGPEWSVNMDIVDRLNSSTPSREMVTDCLRAISARIKDDNSKCVFLALVVLETVMKNCGPMLAQQITQQLMSELVAMARGSRGRQNADQSARLIQQWGRSFEKDRAHLPIFFDTYVALKAKGLSFPPEDDSHGGAFNDSLFEELPAVSSTYKSPLSFPPPPPSQAAAAGKATGTGKQSPTAAASYINHVPPASSCAMTNIHEFQRLEADLATVFDKVALCQDVLRESAHRGAHSHSQNHTLVGGGEGEGEGEGEGSLLLEVVGFLEACRDRLSDVIEAGTQGLLTEALLGRCLSVYDAVLRTLEAERSGSYGHYNSGSSGSSGGGGSGKGVEGGLSGGGPRPAEATFSSLSLSLSQSLSEDAEEKADQGQGQVSQRGVGVGVGEKGSAEVEVEGGGKVEPEEEPEEERKAGDV